MFDDYLKEVAAQLSERPTRGEFATVTGLLKPRTLANRDAAGTGIGGTLYGKSVRYEKEAAISWLRQYLENNAQRFGKMNKPNGDAA